MGPRKKILGWFAVNADLPSELLPGRFLLEILGQDRVLIENHQGIWEYGDERICVKTSFGSVSVCGKGLHLSCLSRERLVINGPICQILVTRG